METDSGSPRPSPVQPVQIRLRRRPPVRHHPVAQRHRPALLQYPRLLAECERRRRQMPVIPRKPRARLPRIPRMVHHRQSLHRPPVRRPLAVIPAPPRRLPVGRLRTHAPLRIHQRAPVNRRQFRRHPDREQRMLRLRDRHRLPRLQRQFRVQCPPPLVHHRDHEPPLVLHRRRRPRPYPFAPVQNLHLLRRPRPQLQSHRPHLPLRQVIVPPVIPPIQRLTPQPHPPVMRVRQRRLRRQRRPAHRAVHRPKIRIFQTPVRPVRAKRDVVPPHHHLLAVQVRRQILRPRRRLVEINRRRRPRRQRHARGPAQEVSSQCRLRHHGSP